MCTSMSVNMALILEQLGHGVEQAIVVSEAAYEGEL